MSNYNIVTNTLLGVALGDALGLPVEFVSRDYLKANPIQNMIGFGTHNQPKGSWSDDSSLTLCLAESLCTGYNLENIAQLFAQWFQEAYWTPHNEVFDVGGATSKAINKIIQGISPLKTGGVLERDNGNGALMRIIPLAFYLKKFKIADRFKITRQVTSITHAHLRSVLCSFIYIEICIQILAGESKKNAYYEAVYEVNDFCKGKKDPASSDNPDKAVISLENNRETTYKTYIAVQNELVAAYNELRNERAKSLYGKSFAELEENYKDVNWPGNKESLKKKIDQIKVDYPQKLSEVQE